MPERSNGAVSKTVEGFAFREFKSRPLRFFISGRKALRPMQAKWHLPVFLLMAIFYGMPCAGQQTRITFAYNRAFVTFEGIDDWEFKPVQVGDKFGFSTGPATGAWGITSPSGEVQINPLFDKVCRFVNGYAAVKLDGCWGVIDTTAAFVIEPSWEKVWSPENDGHPGQLTMRFSGDGVDADDLYEVDPLEDWTNGFAPGIFPLRKDDCWHIVSADGTEPVNRAYSSMKTMTCSRVAVQHDRLWGYLGPDGLPKVPFQFAEAGNFSEDRAAVRREYLWGYIDIDGRVVVPEQFDSAIEFASGAAIITKKFNYGIIDRAGNFLVKPEYFYINRYAETDLFMVYTNFEVGLFQPGVGMIVPPIYKECKILPDGSIWASMDDKEALFDRSGKIMLPLAPRNLSWIGESIILINENGLLSLFRTTDRKLFERSYRVVHPFSEGRAAFQNEQGLWGFLDTNLNEVIPADFTWVTNFKDSQAAVENASDIVIIGPDGQQAKNPELHVRPLRSKSGWSLVVFQHHVGLRDEKGKWKLRPEFLMAQDFSTGVMMFKQAAGWVIFAAESGITDSRKYEEAGNISEDRCWVKAGGKVGYIDQSGQLVIPLQYDAATDMCCGKAAVKKGKLWGFITADGKEILPHIFTDIRWQPDGSFMVNEGEKKGFVSREGQFMQSEQETRPAEKN